MLILVFLLVQAIRSVDSSLPNENDKIKHVKLSPEETLRLYQHWIDQAFGGLFAAIATHKIKHSPRHVDEDHKNCAKNSKDVISHAKCISKLLHQNYKTLPRHKEISTSFIQDDVKNLPIQKTIYKNRKAYKSPDKTVTRYKNLPRISFSNRHHKINFKEVRRKLIKKYFISRLQKYKFQSKRSKLNILPIHQFKRSKRDIFHKNQYELHSTYEEMTPLGAVGRLLRKTLLASSNKADNPWQATVEKIRNLAVQKHKNRKHDDAFVVDDKFRSSYDAKNLQITPKLLKNHQNSQLSLSKPQQTVVRFLRDGIKLVYSLTDKNMTDFDKKNIKAFSPRFLSVVPEADDTNQLGFMSPSLFSIHDKGKGIEKLTSLPNLVKGFTRRDQQEWLNFVFDAAGVNEKIEELTKGRLSSKIQFSIHPNENDGIEEVKMIPDQPVKSQISHFTKDNITQIYGHDSYENRKIEVWEKLVKSYSPSQLAELNATGYTTLTKKQINLIYGPGSPFNNSEALLRLSSLNSSTIHELMMHDIQKIASARSFKLRLKDTYLSPSLFAPTINAYPALNQLIVLSPIAFSPIIQTPILLGGVVLSPLFFSPVILSPVLLEALILVPAVASPFILTPMVLAPEIFVPGVFVPKILSPRVLFPHILNPQVFSPFILSPLVLAPVILSPAIGLPLILSPFVLTPLIWSPQVFMAIVLSPYAMSPNIDSKLTLSTILFSPSFMS